MDVEAEGDASGPRFPRRPLAATITITAKIECVFEQWEPVYDPKPWRVVDPPQRVMVDVSAAIAHDGGRSANDLPLRVRAEGLDLDVRVRGLLRAWGRTSRGEWLAACTFAIPTGNKRGSLEITQWCPASAITAECD
jgi:hypothetical protein